MVFYFVQRGESLYHIAERYQTTVHAIITANGLDDPNAVALGQALIIPKPGEVPLPEPGGIVHVVRPGETVFHLVRKYGTPAPAIIRANQLAHPEFILPGQQLVIPEPPEIGDEWPMAGRTPGRAAASPALLPGPPATGWCYLPRRRGRAVPSAPVVRYGRVFAGLGDGVYYAIDLVKGRARWRLPVPELPENRPALAAPAVYDGLVYIGTPTGLLLAADALRGAVIWKTAVGAGNAPCSLGSPCVVGGLVYAGAADGQVLAAEAKTGALVWRYQGPAPITAPVAAAGGCIYARAADGTLAALAANSGEVRWRQKVTGPGEPVCTETAVLVGGVALDPVTAETLWHLPAPTSPACGAELAYYPDGAVDIALGEYRWRRAPNPAGTAALVAGVVAAGTLLLGAGTDAKLWAWRIGDGCAAWHVDLGAVPCHPPAVVPGLLLTTLADGSLRAICFRPETD